MAVRVVRRAGASMIDVDVETTSLQHHGAETCDTFLAQFGGDTPEAPGVSIFELPEKRREVAHWLGMADGYRAWNSKFDLHCLKQAGFTLPPDKYWHDGMVAAHIIDERTSVALQARANALFGEDEAGARYEVALKQWLVEEDRRRRKASKESGEEFVAANYSDVPAEIMRPYAANDIVQTRAVGGVCYPQIENNPTFRDLYALEMDVMRGLFWAEDRGIPMDREALVNLEAELLPALDRLEDRTVELAEFDGFNPRSPKQISEALERLDADTRAMSRSGTTKQLVTDQENLEACDHPLAETILAYRGEQKLHAMLRGILHTGSNDALFPAAYLTAEDRVHPNFRQVGARTGRMSCSNPNFQQVPRDDLRLRYAVKADPGHKLVAVDLDSIEMRLLAAFAGNGSLVDAIRDGDDIHAMTAKRVGLSGRRRSTGATESARDQGKRMNYLIIYGGGLRAIRKWFGVDQNRARRIYDAMQRAYPEVANLQAQVEWKLEDRGYLESPLTGRRWRMYGSGYEAVKKEGYRFINYLIQGTAADVIKIATARCHKEGIPIIAVVHDEIVAHVPEADAEEAARIIVKSMTEGFELLKGGEPLEKRVPLGAEAQIVDRWSQAKKPDYVPEYAKEST